MSVSFWNDKSNGKSFKYDIVIIGGGIAGLSSAYWLLKEDRSLKIAILEKYTLGAGATGRNAGFITCGSVEHFSRLVEAHGEKKALEIWRFSEMNLELLKSEIILSDADELAFEQKGSFSLASDLHEFTELKNSAKIMNKLNIDVEILDESAIQDRLGAQKFCGGIKYKLDGSINPIKLLQKIKSILNDKIDFFENHEVFEIEQINNDKLIRTNEKNFETSIVVLATNAYSALLAPFFKEKIYPTRGQIMMLEPVEHFMEGPCYANFVLDYFRQLPTGELVIGGFRQLQKDSEKGYSDETSEEIQQALEQFVRTHIPKLSKAKVTHRWSGIMGFSVDGQPMVGALRTDPQIFFLGGFTAHGMGLAFNSARFLAKTIYGKELPSFLSAQRFNN